MEPEAKYTLVGTIVLVLLALLAAAIFWLKTTGGPGDDVSYKIYFARHSLEGLQVRSDVKMKGIKVGTVTGFRISSRHPGTVEVSVKVDGTAPVHQGTRADVERHLLTGIASIRLVNIRDEGEPLTEAPPGEPYPVIAEGESNAQQLSESMAQMALRADDTMKRIGMLLSDENQAALAEILANLRRVSGKLDHTLDAMTRAADEVRTASIGVAGDVHKLEVRYDSLGEESTIAVRDVAAALRRIGADVTQLTGRADALITDGNVELRATAQELRTAADALGAAARTLGEPRKVLFGPPADSLGPGEAAK